MKLEEEREEEDGQWKTENHNEREGGHEWVDMPQRSVKLERERATQGVAHGVPASTPTPLCLGAQRRCPEARTCAIAGMIGSVFKASGDEQALSPPTFPVLHSDQRVGWSLRSNSAGVVPCVLALLLGVLSQAALRGRRDRLVAPPGGVGASRKLGNLP